MDQKQTGRVAILVAVITAAGGLGAAAITNWDKLFGTKSETPTSVDAANEKIERLRKNLKHLSSR